MIKVLEKALDILEYMVCDPDREYRLTELAGVTGDAATTTANILRTLCAREYLVHGETRGTYRLGGMARGMTPYAGLDVRLRDAAAEPMKALVAEFNASGVLSALRGGEKHVIARYRSDSVIEVNMEVVASNALFGTSTGVVLLSALPDAGAGLQNARERAEKSFETWDYYRKVIADVREEGFFYSSMKPSITEAAVPVHIDGKVVCAIGIYFPKLYQNALTKPHTVAALIRTAETIENNLEVRT